MEKYDYLGDDLDDIDFDEITQEFSFDSLEDENDEDYYNYVFGLSDDDEDEYTELDF